MTQKGHKVMSNAMDWMKKVVSVCETAVEKYDTATKVAERAIMDRCGSERTMDEVVDESAGRVIGAAKKGITKGVEKSRPVVKKIKTQVKEKACAVGQTVKDKTKKVCSSEKDCSADKKRVPLGRPVPHIPGDYAPESGVPQSDKKPESMSMAGRMKTHAHRGTLGVPIVVCK